MGSYPTFSPLPCTAGLKRFARLAADSPQKDEPKVSPPACHRGLAAGLQQAHRKLHRRYVFCGTVRGRALRGSPACGALTISAQPPGVTRRAALQSEALRPRTAESGLSSTPTTVRSRGSDHPTCPPLLLYPLSSRPSTHAALEKRNSRRGFISGRGAFQKRLRRVLPPMSERGCSVT